MVGYWQVKEHDIVLPMFVQALKARGASSRLFTVFDSLISWEGMFEMCAVYGFFACVLM